jgi:hypothetical protein
VKERRGLQLCTFEVATPVGRHARVGAFDSGRIVDLNFATAWYMEQTGEREAQRFADALVPANMADFVRAGQRALFTAVELFLGAEPPPRDWWLGDAPPLGPNGETLAYRPEEVRLLAPLPSARTVAPCEDLPFDGEWSPRLAAIAWKSAGPGEARPRDLIFGYTLGSECGRYSALGPYVVTPDRVAPDAAITVRVNGEARGSATVEEMEARVAASGALLPGDLVTQPIAFHGEPPKPGDTVEIEMAGMGTLRSRLAPAAHAGSHGHRSRSA